MYPYGLIGNCQCSGLVSVEASLDWLCLPRPDSAPVFGRLLDPEGGHFSIAPAGAYQATQTYLENTNVLVTRFKCADGSSFQVTDFCPRFGQYGRVYRPLSLFRIVEPLEGQPQVKVELRPVEGWSRRALTPSRGNSHLRYTRGTDYLRLATNMSLTYLCEDVSFGLREPAYFALTFNGALEDDLQQVSRDFERKTLRYWRDWVKHCDIPTRHQEAAIRSALALKLHCFEDTGAILASLSSSLPEAPGESRNWDYRFCWLRDAYFSLGALRSLGHFEEMEGFLRYLLDLAHTHRDRLGPVYRLDRSLPLPEVEQPDWAGWRGSRPVRSGNQAAEHVQNDVYGEMILTLAPLFLDQRFAELRHPDHQRLMVDLARRCARSVGEADAGLWELRSNWKRQCFTHLLLWAGLDRASRLASAGHLPGLTEDLGGALRAARSTVESMTADGGGLGNAEGDPRADASLLLAPVLGFPGKELMEGTVAKVLRELRWSGDQPAFLCRYRHADDFGEPEAAFVACSFWLVQALAKLGRLDEARAVMDGALGAANHLGLYSEHFRPDQKLQTGNFPQAYSHVGLIHGAFAVSEPWDLVL
ncbi:MAG: glycoside hydrolase family 15 protein [bacterium]